MKSENKLIKIESITVSEIETQIRLSDFIPGKFKSITSHKGMKNAVKKGLVTLNGKRAFTGDYIKGGETIELYQDKNQNTKPNIDINLDVLFEDEHLAIVYKPAGIVVSGNKKWTLENALSGNLKKSDEQDALIRPEPIHRLDYPTSGALVIGKTSKAVLSLNKMFEEKTISKTYHAVTIGQMEKSGIYNSPIEGKKSESHFKVLESLESPRFGFLNLVELSPKTGRKHQLRIHTSEKGNPILGDLEHGTEELILKGKGLYLHATAIEFVHPVTKAKIFIKTNLPKKFLKLFPVLT